MRSAIWIGPAIIGIVLVQPAHAQPFFADIDRHALSAPPQAELALDHLAAYLAQAARSDTEKARAVFRWMTDRISFDMDAYDTQHHGAVRPEAVLARRRAVCFGFSALFDALAQRLGLESITVAGYARGVGFFDEEVDPPQTRFQPNHTWNAVKVDGQWRFVDVTRGAGYIKAQRFRRVLQEQYFFTPPAQLIRTHLPADPRWQLLPMPVTLTQFEALPYADAGYLRLGMTSETRLDNHRDRTSLQANLEMYLKHGWLKVLAAPPPASPLPPGRDYYFLLEAPHACDVAVCQGETVLPLRRYGTRFEGAVRPHPGPMTLSMRTNPAVPLEPVLDYQVAAWPGTAPAAPPPAREKSILPAWLNVLKRGQR
jgi:hypothetical protein